jgi:multidrug efflux system membrane fusion protein
VVQARNAELEAKRVAALLSKGVAAQADFDQAQTAAEALAAAVQADQAAAQNARLQLEYCTLRAPLDGRVGSVFLNQGNVIKANDLTMVVINQTRPVYVTFSAPEQRLPEIRRSLAAGALPVRAVVPGDEGPPAEGQLSFIDNAVDETTGMIRLKATFENGDERLWPGQFVNVVLTLATQPRAIVVPSRAVQTSQQGRFVFVVKPDLGVEVRPVEIGQAIENDVIIEKGLQVGERVVTDGLLRLTAESKVEIGGGAAGAPERRTGGEPAAPAATEGSGAAKTGGGTPR